jgi:hypothetical protein
MKQLFDSFLDTSKQNFSNWLQQSGYVYIYIKAASITRIVPCFKYNPFQ